MVRHANAKRGWLMLPALVALSLTLLAGVSAQSAQAYDNAPCYPAGVVTLKHGGHNWKTNVRTCPLWRGNVPVHYTTNHRSPIVGYLYKGGHANWFIAEKWGSRQHLGGSYNAYWASTMADNGRIGWVNEVYFSGGGNDEDDRGLLGPPGQIFCPGTPCYYPPWWKPPTWSPNVRP